MENYCVTINFHTYLYPARWLDHLIKTRKVQNFNSTYELWPVLSNLIKNTMPHVLINIATTLIFLCLYLS